MADMITLEDGTRKRARGWNKMEDGNKMEDETR